MTSENPYRVAGAFRTIYHTDGELPEREILWWGVTTGSLTYAAIGSSPYMATLAVSEALETSLDQFEIIPFFVEEYPHDIQERLNIKFGERKAVRVLVNSIVEFPNT